MFMKKLIIIITGLISLCFAAIVIGILFLSNLDPNNYKDWISEQFYQQTGRELSISGNIQLSFYPWLGLGSKGWRFPTRKAFPHLSANSCTAIMLLSESN